MHIVDGYLERIWGRLYDTCYAPAGPLQKQTLFNLPVGSRVDGRTKSFADTNMVIPACLPPPMRFDARRLRLEILSSYVMDLEELKRTATLSFQVHCKRYFEAPLSTLVLDDWLRKAIAEIGEHQDKEIGPYLDKALANGNLGLAAFSREDFFIEQQEPFTVNLHPNEPAILHGPFVFRVFIEGPEYRAVQ